MSRWVIYGKDSNGLYTQRVVVDNVKYNGARMSERFITVSVKSAVPIDFKIGDYMVYRGERFEINYDPTVIKKARRGTYGEGFTYSDIKLNSLGDELVRCDFQDIVLRDSRDDTNKMRYSVSPNVNAYCDTVDDLLDRIQANLNDLYGTNKWFIYSPWLSRSVQRGCSADVWALYYPSELEDVPETLTGINGVTDGVPDYKVTKQVVSTNNQKCWDALLIAYTTFKLSFIVRGRNIIVGSAGNFILQDFRYGKGNGLIQIERNTDQNQAVITRLRSYGTEKNIPYRYYHYNQIVPYLYCYVTELNNYQPVSFDWFEGSDDNHINTVPYKLYRIAGNVKIKPNVVIHEPNPPREIFNILSKADQEYLQSDFDIINNPNMNSLNNKRFYRLEDTIVNYLGYPQAESSWQWDENTKEIAGFDIRKIYISNTKASGRQGATIVDAYFVKINVYNDYTRNTYHTSDYVLLVRDSQLTPVTFAQGNPISNPVYITDGVYKKSQWPTTQIDYLDNAIPDNMDVTNLMLPGFPNESLHDWVLAHDGVLNNDGSVTWGGYTAFFSQNPHRPYIESVNKNLYGLRPYSVYFDGSDEKKEIFPTIEELTVGDVRVAGYENNGWSDDVRIDEVIVTDDLRITDNGHDIGGFKAINEDGEEVDMQKRFSVYMPDAGFDVKAAIENAGAECSMEVIDGFLAGRTFNVKYVEGPLTIDGLDGPVYRLDCERVEDAAISTWFPYKDYYFRNGDHFALTGIDLPEEYISAAAVKLLRNSLEWLSKNDTTKHLLVPKIDNLFMAREHEAAVANNRASLYQTIEEGTLMNIEDDDLGSMSLYIDTLIIKEDSSSYIPEYEITLKNDKDVSSIQKTVENIVTDSLESSNSGYSVSQIKQIIETYGEEYFVSKRTEDTARESIGFKKGMWVKSKDSYGVSGEGDATVANIEASGDLNVSGTGIFGRWLQALYGIFGSIFSSDYSGDGVADTGWRLTNDYNGHSKLTVDELYVRMRAIFEELEVKKESVSAGNEVQSCASNIILRVDYLDANDDVLGYTETRSPWRLGNAALLLRNAASILSTSGSERTEVDIDDVKKIRCYFLANDGDRVVKNEWKVGDFARCQTFNLSSMTRNTYLTNYTSAGANTIIEGRTKAGNIFWWRKVIGVSTDPVTVDGKDMHYFDLSVTDCWEGSDIPVAGDNVSQWGNDRDPERMNLICREVNGADAPCVKFYEGIYTYNMSLCWYGGNPCKAILSPKSGYKFIGSKFLIETEYGTAPVPMERGAWLDITPTADSHHITSLARKCYYYDSVSYNGSLWLCVKTRSYMWVASEAFSQEFNVEVSGSTVAMTISYAAGEEVTNERYAALTQENKVKCHREEDYTTDAPSEHSSDWQKRVSKGDNGVTPVKGVDYEDGKDAVLVKPLSENVIIKQSRTKVNNAYPLLPVGNKTISGQSTPVLAFTELQVIVGETAKTVTTDFTVGTPVPSTFGTNSPVCNAVVCDDGKTVAITAVNVDNGSYVESGYITIPVIYNQHTYYARFNFVCELMGSYKEEIIGDTKTAIAQSTLFDLQNNEIVPSEYLGTFIQSSTQALSQLTKDTQSNNLVEDDGWMDENEIGVEYNENSGLIGTSDNDDIYSYDILLEAGVYTFSAYVDDDASFYVYLGGYGSSDYESLSSVFVEETYGGKKRAYATFEIEERQYVSLNVFAAGGAAFYRPMLEIGDVMSPYVKSGETIKIKSIVKQTADAITQIVNGKASTSYVTQTANAIKQAVVDALGETGIDISGTNRLIELIASKIVFSYYDNGVKKSDKIGINSSTGELSAVGGTFTRINVEDAKITGSLMFHKVLTSSKSSTEQGMTLFTGSGEGAVLLCDTFIIVGQRRSSGYSVFLPPARYFKGVKVKIINATTSAGPNGLEMDLSPIALEVLNGTTPKYLTDVEENVRNTIVAGVPFKYSNGNQDNLLVGAPFSGYVTTNGGLLASGSTLYNSIELVATNNPYAGDGTDCAWMIINAEEE